MKYILRILFGSRVGLTQQMYKESGHLHDILSLRDLSSLRPTYAYIPFTGLSTSLLASRAVVYVTEKICH